MVVPLPQLKKKSPFLVYGLGAVALLAPIVIYLVFFSQPAAQPPSPPAGAHPAVANPNDARLRGLRFNLEVLRDPRFQTLRVFGTLPVTASRPPLRATPFVR
ncbi:hypothetical protein HY442_02380 [Candidatus Parcubacteria bacterium]|nr:hypothetical protein [Candidatus Parcubacteria bacterium]MBI4099348.1 hypothetical protein [Candidatus Parcubacteria bacterium]